MKNIIVTGSLAFDFIMDFPQTFAENILPDKLKTLSVSFLAQNFSKNYGGVAGNIAYNLALLDKEATIVASAGSNDFEPYKQHLLDTGVDVSKINAVANEFSANMFMMTDKNNCQIAGFYPGAMTKDSTLSLPDNTDFVIVAPTMPDAMDNFVNQAKKAHIPCLYDPAQQIPRITKEQLQNGITGAEILIGNDYELALITKKTGWSKKEILQKVTILITTLGEKGSVIETKDTIYSISTAKPEKIIDPTGAGDAYIAGFLAGYLNKKDLQASGQMGATAASFAIEKYGTQRHQFATQDFQDRYIQAFGDMLELER